MLSEKADGKMMKHLALGRPRQMPNGKRRNVYLDDADVEQLKKIGGTTSGGIRKLLILENMRNET